MQRAEIESRRAEVVLKIPPIKIAGRGINLHTIEKLVSQGKSSERMAVELNVRLRIIEKGLALINRFSQIIDIYNSGIHSPAAISRSLGGDSKRRVCEDLILLGMWQCDKRHFSVGESALALVLRRHGYTWRSISEELAKEFGYRRDLVTLRKHVGTSSPTPEQLQLAEAKIEMRVQESFADPKEEIGGVDDAREFLPAKFVAWPGYSGLTRRQKFAVVDLDGEPDNWEMDGENLIVQCSATCWRVNPAGNVVVRIRRA